MRLYYTVHSLSTTVHGMLQKQCGCFYHLVVKCPGCRQPEEAVGECIHCVLLIKTNCNHVEGKLGHKNGIQ